MSKKTQATLVLVIMFLGFIATYKLDSFWGLLLNHGFLAALIGGLADWFAVTALFRKPLGFISYRTEILPRNRDEEDTSGDRQGECQETADYDADRCQVQERFRGHGRPDG